MKNKIIKTIILSSAFTLLMLITHTACGDLLDQEPQGQWTEKDQKSGSFESSVFELYGSLKQYNASTGMPALAIHNWRSEDIEKGSEKGDNAQHAEMYDDFGYTTNNGLIGTYWSGNYGMIHKSNDLIDTLRLHKEAGHELTNSDLINLGEAYFIRSFCYFNLVRAYGEVPLIDFKLKDAMDSNIPKSEAGKIYELIDKDLKLASEYLPSRWDAKFVGRLTKGAADALHARTYMMRNNWANMYAKAQEVISSGEYNLNTSFDKIFRETGENCSESIFELQCMSTTDRPSNSNIGSQFAQIQGVRGAGDWNLGWGYNCPTQELADAFESGDPRKDETLLYFYKNDEEALTTPTNKPWGEKPRANPNVMNKYYNKKAYTDPSIRRQVGHLQGYWVNVRIIRYADVVLMAAEAANELGQTTEAANLLEMVRARARGSNMAVLPKRTTGDQVEMRDFVKHERRIELAGEWDRFYDLVRWGDARIVLHAAQKTAYQDKHKLLPIPQGEIDKSNGVLVQNSNY